jgi:hypothetical protein
VIAFNPTCSFPTSTRSRSQAPQVRGETLDVMVSCLFRYMLVSLARFPANGPVHQVCIFGLDINRHYHAGMITTADCSRYLFHVANDFARSTASLHADKLSYRTFIQGSVIAVVQVDGAKLQVVRLAHITSTTSHREASCDQEPAFIDVLVRGAPASAQVGLGHRAQLAEETKARCESGAAAMDYF